MNSNGNTFIWWLSLAVIWHCWTSFPFCFCLFQDLLCTCLYVVDPDMAKRNEVRTSTQIMQYYYIFAKDLLTFALSNALSSCLYFTVWSLPFSYFLHLFTILLPHTICLFQRERFDASSSPMTWPIYCACFVANNSLRVIFSQPYAGISAIIWMIFPKRLRLRSASSGKKVRTIDLVYFSLFHPLFMIFIRAEIGPT